MPETTANTSLLPNKALSNKDLFGSTCKLYTRSLLSSLIISLITLGLFAFFSMLPKLLPDLDPSGVQLLSMMGYLILIPFLSTIWLIQLHIAQHKRASLGMLIGQAYQRTLPLLGSLVSMCFIPAIIVGILFIAYIALLKLWMPNDDRLLMLMSQPLYIIGVRLLIGILVIVLMSTKLFAPLLVYTDQKDAETALNTSSNLVKPDFIRTTLYHLYGMGILVLAYFVPTLMHYYFPQIALTEPLQQGIRVVLLALLIPWTMSFWLVRLYDLKRGQN